MSEFLTILKHPHPNLRLKAVPIASIEDRHIDILDKMEKTMLEAKGIGLSATQVNIQERMIVVLDEDLNSIKMINPEIIWPVENEHKYPTLKKIDNNFEEGCLSFPKVYGNIPRWEKINVKYLDETGIARLLNAEGLLSKIIQHEIDHLDGILFIDRVSKLKRNRMLKKVKKL